MAAFSNNAFNVNAFSILAFSLGGPPTTGPIGVNDIYAATNISNNIYNATSIACGSKDLFFKVIIQGD